MFLWKNQGNIINNMKKNSTQVNLCGFTLVKTLYNITL